MKYYTDEKGIRHVLSDPDEAIRFIEDEAELEREMSKPPKFEEAFKRLIGVLFKFKRSRDLDRL